jgi:hypothetical protein
MKHLLRIQGNRFKSYLEIVTNLALLVVAVTIIAVMISGYLKRTAPLQLENGFHKGDRLPAIRNVDYGSTDRTLLILMSTKCDYCKLSLPFYAQLADKAKYASTAIQVVAVFPNTAAEVQRYTTSNDLNLRTIPEIRLGELHVSATPTLILTSRDGTIQDFWVGLLSSENQQEVLSKIRQP